MQTVRVHHYSVAPADFEEFLERRGKVIDAIRADHPGLSEALLIKLEDGTYTDIWRWESAAQMQAAFAAAGAVAEIGPAMSLTNQATAVNGTVVGPHENRSNN